MIVLAALVRIPANLGYAALAGLVLGESAGIPIPGETALIAAGVLAQQGHLTIELVIAIAAAAAIVGDNIGYVIGKTIGYRLLTRPGRFERRRAQALETGQRFFDKHGPKAVFLGRWIAGLRVWASWLAGITSMPWHVFVLWNALGGIAWATSVGLVAYFVGEAATHAFATGGAIAGVAIVVLIVAAIVFIKLRERRASHSEPGPEHGSGPGD